MAFKMIDISVDYDSSYDIVDVKDISAIDIEVGAVIAGPAGASAIWGEITGAINNQVDLQIALGLKYDASNPAGYISGLDWGQITGSLASQTDLQIALNSKADLDDLTSYILKSGDTMTGSLKLASLYLSDDIAGGIDSTSRINLHSYQRANYNGYGEVERIFLMMKDAKAMQAYYVPKLGYNADRTPKADLNPDGTPANINQWQAISWTGSHWEANDHGSDHVHYEIEIPDAAGALQGRFEIPFANPKTGVIGLDKTWIITNLADFVVRTSNSQALRLASPAGNHKPIEFNHDAYGDQAFRRWVIRANNTAETGSNAGTDFQFARYADDGTFIDSPLFLQRSTGFAGFGTITTPSRISLAASTVAAGGIGFGSDTNLFRSAANVLKTDDKFIAALGFETGGAITSIKTIDQATNKTSTVYINVNPDRPLEIHGDHAEYVRPFVNNNGTGDSQFSYASSNATRWSTGYQASTGNFVISNSFQLSAAEKLVITAAGLIGMGVAPTAALHIKASTTAAASLRLGSGVAPTAPNNGDIWFDGTNIKARIGGVTKTFVMS